MIISMLRTNLDIEEERINVRFTGQSMKRSTLLSVAGTKPHVRFPTYSQTDAADSKDD